MVGVAGRMRADCLVARAPDIAETGEFVDEDGFDVHVLELGGELETGLT